MQRPALRLKAKTSFPTHWQSQPECFVGTFTMNKTHKYNPDLQAVFMSNLFSPRNVLCGWPVANRFKVYYFAFYGKQLNCVCCILI